MLIFYKKGTNILIESLGSKKESDFKQSKQCCEKYKKNKRCKDCPNKQE